MKGDNKLIILLSCIVRAVTNSLIAYFCLVIIHCEGSSRNINGTSNQEEHKQSVNDFKKGMVVLKNALPFCVTIVSLIITLILVNDNNSVPLSLTGLSVLCSTILVISILLILIFNKVSPSTDNHIDSNNKD